LLSLLQYSPPKCEPKAEVVERVAAVSTCARKLYFNTTPDIRVPAFSPAAQGARRSGDPRLSHCMITARSSSTGKEKVVAMENEHPLLTEFSGPITPAAASAGELAKRGYVRHRHRHVLLGRAADALSPTTRPRGATRHR